MMNSLQRIGGKFNSTARGGRLKVLSTSLRSVAYLFDEASTFLYALHLRMNGIPTESFRVSSFLLLSSAVSVHSVFDFNCCFCKDGTIYTIPSDDLMSGSSEETEAFACDSDTDMERNSTEDSPWNIIFVEGTRRLFADKLCSSINIFRDELAVLSKNPMGWNISLHEAIANSPRKPYQRQPFVTFDLPCRAGEEDDARFLSCFQTLSRGEPDFVEPLLLESLFGRELSVQRGHLAFVTAGAGEVFYAFWTSRESNWSQNGPLFCLHQSVVDVWIPKFIDDPNRFLHGLVFVGRLGKMVMFSSRRDSSEGYMITEFHVPSPVLCCSHFGNTIVHSDGVCLWKNTLQFEVEGPRLKTESLGIPGVTQIAMWNLDDENSLVLLTDDGHVYLKRRIQDWNSDSLSTDNETRTSTPISLEYLLNTIQDSSERLSATCEAQEVQRRILRSLSTASHLALNKKLRQTFLVDLVSRWSPYDPLSVTFDVKLSSTAIGFAMTEDEWHFVVSVGSSVNDGQTKTVPVSGGPVPEAGITLVTNFIFPESLHLCTSFPLTVMCGLHYEPRGQENQKVSFGSAPIASDDGRLAFVVPLKEFLVDGLTFLRQQQSSVAKLLRPQRQKEMTLADSILDITENRRIRLGLPATVPRKRIYPELAPVGNAVTLNLSCVFQLLGCDASVGKDELLKQLLGRLTRDSINIDVAGMTRATVTATVFDSDVTIGAVVDGSLAKLVVTSDCPSLAIGLRHAVLRKLKLEIENANLKSSKDKSEQESFVVPKTILHNYRDLNMKLNEIDLAESHTEQVVHRLYKETRDFLSCRLPFR